MRIGLISDTHGRLRPDVFRRFEGVEHIVHAGDVGGVGILDELEAIAPVTAVYGNTDGMGLRSRVEEVARLQLGGHELVVVHGHQLGSPTPGALRSAHPDARVIVFGHTHRPLIDETGGVLVVNPGAAGAARFGLAPSVGILTVDEEPSVELVELTD